MNIKIGLNQEIMFKPKVLNAIFVEFNSKVFLKGCVGHKASGIDNLKICFIRQTLKILFCHSGNSAKKWTLLYPTEPFFFWCKPHALKHF